MKFREHNIYFQFQTLPNKSDMSKIYIYSMKYECRMHSAILGPKHPLFKPKKEKEIGSVELHIELQV